MSRLRLNKILDPSAPMAGKVELYVGLDSKMRMIDSDGLIGIMSTQLFNRNVIINGSFDLAQRQDPTTPTVYSSLGGRVYCADRWFISTSVGTISYKQSSNMGTPENGITGSYCGDFIRSSTADSKVLIGQAVESLNVMHLRGRDVRVSLKMKWETDAITVRMGLAQLTAAGTANTIPKNAGTFVTAWGANGIDPTLGANLSYITPAVGSAFGGTISGQAMTCNLTPNWTQYSATFSIPTNVKNLILMIWTDAAIPDNLEFDMTEVDMYAGTELRPWYPIMPSEQLRLCQRYYAKTFLPAIAPATTAGNLGALIGSVAVAGNSPYASAIYWTFPSDMVITPVITLYNPQVNNNQIYNVIHTNAPTNSAGANITYRGCEIICTGANAWVSGDILRVHAVADAEI